MNDRSQLMNQSRTLNPPPQVMRKMNPPPPPPPQFMNQSQLMGQSTIFSQPRGSVMKQRSYKPWQTQQDSNFNKNKKFHGSNQGFGRSNWNNKKPNQSLGTVMNGGAVGFRGGYQPPTLNELQHENRVKARSFYPKKKFNNRFAPYAPRNTSSFIMRAKKSGGITSLVSPCPLTPAVLPTPVISPSREVLVDMATEEWGVDGYGSMKGLIRLRNEEEDENEEEDSGSSESDLDEEKNSVLNRLDHEMSRFEMVYPNQGGDYNNALENRVDDQDSHIAQLEEENLTLKERLFLMERDLEDLRGRLLFLERQNQMVDDDVNEENVSENASQEGPDHGIASEGKQDVMDYVDANIEARDCDDDDDDDINVVSAKVSEDVVNFAATEAVLEFDLEKVNDDPSNENLHNKTEEEVKNEEEREGTAENELKKCNEEDGGSLHS